MCITPCQESVKLWVELLWCLLKTLRTESTVYLCSWQQFAVSTASAVVERDEMSLLVLLMSTTPCVTVWSQIMNVRIMLLKCALLIKFNWKLFEQKLIYLALSEREGVWCSVNWKNKRQFTLIPLWKEWMRCKRNNSSFITHYFLHVYSL
jgi:hypothetical protein